jgi:uncharacterized repeat protein (TIGR04042 family)
MPETHLKIQWPNGSEETCYSPSSIVKQYFEPNRDYELVDFVDRAQTALNIASDRVRANYGSPCGLAIGKLVAIQSKATQFNSHLYPVVRTIEFLD